MKQGRFKVVKFMDVGTSNPICNRLSLQLFDMIDSNLFNITKEERDKFMEIMLDIMKGLLTCEDTFKRIESIHNKFIEDLQSGEKPKITHNSISFDDPTDEIYELFEALIVKLIIVLRKSFKLPCVFYNVKIDGPKVFYKQVLNLFGENSKVVKMVEDDKKWFTELYDLRGEFEHSKIELSRFDVFMDGEIKFAIPRVKTLNQSVIELSFQYMNYTFTYCEDLAVNILNERINPEAQIYSIPPELQESNRSFCYKVGLSKEYEAELLKNIKSTD